MTTECTFFERGIYVCFYRFFVNRKRGGCDAIISPSPRPPFDRVSIEKGRRCEGDGWLGSVNKVYSIFFSLSLLLLLFSIRKGIDSSTAVADGSVQFLVLLLLTLGTGRERHQKRGRKQQQQCVYVCAILG
jgi:hypothetical protein